MKNIKTTIPIIILLIALLGLFLLDLDPTEEQQLEENNNDQELVSVILEKKPNIIPLPPKPDIIYFDDLDKLISQLKTSTDIIWYVNSEIKYTPKEGNQALSPEELIENKSGGDQDLAVFVGSALRANDLISFTFIYEDTNNNRYYVVAFRDTDLPKYIYFDESGAHAVHHGWSFREIKDHEEERLGIEITRYGTNSPALLELEPQEWVNSI